MTAFSKIAIAASASLTSEVFAGYQQQVGVNAGGINAGVQTGSPYEFFSDDFDALYDRMERERGPNYYRDPRINQGEMIGSRRIGEPDGSYDLGDGKPPMPVKGAGIHDYSKEDVSAPRRKMGQPLDDITKTKNVATASTQAGEEEENFHARDKARCNAGHENRNGKCMKVETEYEKIIKGQYGVSFRESSVAHAWTPYGPLPRVFGVASGLDKYRDSIYKETPTHIYKILERALDAEEEDIEDDWIFGNKRKSDKSKDSKNKGPNTGLSISDDLDLAGKPPTLPQGPKKYHALFHGLTVVGDNAPVFKYQAEEEEAKKNNPPKSGGFMSPIEEERQERGVWGKVFWSSSNKNLLIAEFDAANGGTISTIMLRKLAKRAVAGKGAYEAEFAFGTRHWNMEWRNLSHLPRTIPADLTFDGIEVFGAPGEGAKDQHEL